MARASTSAAALTLQELTYEPTPDVQEEEGSMEAWQRFAPAARALAASAVRRLDVDPFLALHNARLGAKVVREAADTVRARNLPVNWQTIDDLEALGLALVWAVRSAQPLPAKDVRKKMKRASVLRRRLLPVMATLTDWGYGERSEYLAIKKGTGATDTAGDLLALAAWFGRERDSIAGRHPVSPEALQEAHALGTELARTLRPRRAKEAPKQKTKPADSLVDRLYTLLCEAYDEVERAAGGCWGRDAPKRVPSLRTKQSKRRARAPAGGAAKPGVVTASSR